MEAAQNRRAWNDRVDDLVQELEPRAACIFVDDVQWGKLCDRHADQLTDLQFVEEGRRPFTQHWEGILHAYTDGSVITHGDRLGAGYGGVVFGQGYYKEFVVPLLRCEDQSNNRAELLAVVHACELVMHTGRRLVIHTDSLLVWNFVQYQRRELRLSRFARTLNGDILQRLDTLLSTLRDAVCFKVRAHNGNMHNEKADVLAGMASQQAYYVRHSVFAPPAAEGWGVGPKGEPLPAWRKPIEVLAAEKRSLAEKEKSERRRVKRPVMTDAVMRAWFSSVQVGSKVSVTWAYEDGPREERTNEGYVRMSGRRKMISYGALGLQPFPPIAGVDVFVAEVVHPGTSPPPPTGRTPGT
jgi:ribonuclease HI